MADTITPFAFTGTLAATEAPDVVDSVNLWTSAWIPVQATLAGADPVVLTENTTSNFHYMTWNGPLRYPGHFHMEFLYQGSGTTPRGLMTFLYPGAPNYDRLQLDWIDPSGAFYAGGFRTLHPGFPQSVFTITGQSITDNGDGYWRLSVDFTTAGQTSVVPQLFALTAAHASSYLGDGASGYSFRPVKLTSDMGSVYWSGTLGAVEGSDTAGFNRTGTVFYDSSSNVTLSNGDLTATKTALGATADSTTFTADNSTVTVDLVDAGYGGAISTSTRGATKVYAEAHLDNQITAHDVFVGICKPAGESGFLGQSLNSYGWRDDGSIYHNNAVVGTGPTYVTGHWLAVAVDRVAGTAQFRNITTNSAWSSTVNVSDITAADVVLAVSVYQAPEAWTANFDGLFIGAAPSGYTRWDGSAAVQLAATGTLAATEAPDVSSVTGTVTWFGTLATTEGADTASINGLVGRSGTLASTEVVDVSAIAGGIYATGTLAATEVADTASFPGALVRWLATLATIEAGDTASGIGTVTWIGTLASTEGADDATFGGKVEWFGVLAATEVTDTASISGLVRWLATLASTEVADASALAGGVYGTGTLAATEGADSSALVGGICATGTLAVTDVTDTASFPGALVRWLGTLVATEAADTASFPGLVQWFGTLATIEIADTTGNSGAVAWITAFALTEVTDTAAVNGLVGRSGTFAATEVGDTSSLSGAIAWLASLTSTEAPDASSVNVLVSSFGTFVTTEVADAASLGGSVAWRAILASTEASDAAAFPGGLVRWIATLASTEATDAIFFNQGQPVASGTLAANELGDLVSIPGTVLLSGVLATTDGTDTASLPGALVRWIATLAATDGADTASATGTIMWLGSLGATEALDAAGVSGSVTWLGTLAATEGANTASINGLVGLSGTLVPTDGADTASVAALVRWLGTLVTIDGADTSALAGGVYGTGTLTATEGADASQLNGSVTWFGTVSATEVGDAASVNGLVGASGTVTATEGADAAGFSGAVAWLGTLAATDAADVASFPGALVRWLGTLGATETPDSAFLNASVPVAAGPLAAQESADLVALVGTVLVSGVLASTDGSDIASFPGLVRWVATLAATEGADSSALAGGIYATGPFASTEVADAVTVGGSVAWLGTLVPTEGAETSSISGLVGLSGALIVAEAPDAASFPGALVRWLGTLATTEVADTSAVGGGATGTGAFASIEVADLVGVTGTVTWFGALAVTEGAADIAVVSGLVGRTGTLAVTEGAADAASLGGSVAWATAFTLTEVGDPAAVNGLVGRSGTLASTEAADTISVTSGAVTWLGTLAATDGVDTAALAGGIYGTGILTPMEAADVCALAGGIYASITLSATENADKASVSGVTSTNATLTATEAADLVNVSVLVRWLGTLASTEVTDTVSVNGLVGRSGILTSTEVADTASVSGLVRLLATLAVMEAPDRGLAYNVLQESDVWGGQNLTRVGTLVSSTVTENVTAGPDSYGIWDYITTTYPSGLYRMSIEFKFSGPNAVNRELGMGLYNYGDTAGIEVWGLYDATSPLGWSNDFPDNPLFDFLGDPQIFDIGSGFLRAIVDVRISTASGFDFWLGPLLHPTDPQYIGDGVTNFTLNNVSLTPYGFVEWQGTLAATEARDSIFFNEGVPNAAGPLVGQEVADAAHLAGTVIVSGALTTTEGVDTASVSGLVRWIAILAATEARDVSAITGGAVGTGTFAATETADVVNVEITPAWTGTLAVTETIDTAFVDCRSGVGGTLAVRDGADAFAFIGGTHKTFLFDHATSVVLSNQYLTATNTSVGASADSTAYTADNNVLTADASSDTVGNALSQTTRGALKVYAEAHADNLITGGTGGVGFGLRSETLYLGGSLKSYGWRSNGDIYHNGVVVGAGPIYVEGDWLAVAVDRIAGTAQFRNVTANTIWFSPLDVSDITASDIVFGLSFYNAGEAWTANFDSLFIGAAPDSSYTRWDGSQAVQQAATGVLAATETRDVADLEGGQVAWIGTLVAAEVADNVTVSGLVGRVGALNTSEVGDDATFGGASVAWIAVLAATEAPDRAAITGANSWFGTFTATEDADDATVSGLIEWRGRLAASEGTDDATFTVASGWLGTLEALEGADVSRGYGNPIDHLEIEGSLAVTEDTADTVEFDGRASWDSDLTLFEDTDIASGDGLVGWQHLCVTEAADACQIVGTPGVIGALDAIEVNDSCLVSGRAGLIGAISALDAADVFIVSAKAADTNAASFYLSEDVDAANVSGLVGWSVLSATEAGDGCVVSGFVAVLGQIVSQEYAQDTLLASGILGLVGSLEAQEAAEDTRGRYARGASVAEGAAISGGVSNTTWLGTLAAAEVSDIPYLEQAQPLFCALVATELLDRCRVYIDSQSLSFLIRDTLFNALARDPFFAGFEKGNARSPARPRVAKTSTPYTARKTKTLRVQPEQLPYLGVYIVDDTMVPDGDANAGHVRLNHTLRLGYSIIIESNDEELAEQQVDAALKRLMLLLADPYIMNLIDTYNPYLGIDNFGNTIIESVPRATRRQSYGSRNETALIELQFECSYFYREDFIPEIADDLLEIDMNTGIKIGETEDERVQRLQVKAKYKFTPEEMMAALKEAAE